MRKSLERQYIEVALKLLLNQNDKSLVSHPLLSDGKWDVLLDLAKENRIMLRLSECLVNLHIQPDELFRSAVEAEKERINRTIELMSKISDVFEANEIDFVFFKNYQHYPDMGDDIDLFVHRQTDKADSLLIGNFKASPCKRTLLHRMAGKTQYFLEDWSTDVEIHHGRMGLMGEYTVFPKFLVANRRIVDMENVKLWVPCSEDQFIIQVLQRVYGRFFLRISELVYAVNAVFDEDFDWEYIVNTTKSIGIFDGLRFYLSCVGQIYQDVMNKSLPLIKAELSLPGAPVKMKFKDFHYNLPLKTVVKKLYMKKIILDIMASRWVTVGRTCLLPFFAAPKVFKAAAVGCSQKLGLGSPG